MRFLTRTFAAATLAATAWLAAAPVAAQTRLTVFYTANAGYLAPMIAKDQGFFKKRGLDVELTQGSTSYAMTAAVLSGSAQIAGVTPPVLVTALDSGMALTAVAGATTFPDRNGYVGVFARADSGIKTAQDLVGKTVGGPGLGGVLDVLYKKWLADQKVNVRSIKNIETPFAQQADLLKRGQLDAVISAAPFSILITESGVGVRIAELTSAMPAGAITGAFIAASQWAADNPGTVKAFQEALLEAVAYAAANPDGARASLQQYTKMKPELVGKIGLPDMLPRIDASHLQFWIDLCRAQGLIKGQPSADKHVMWRAG